MLSMSQKCQERSLCCRAPPLELYSGFDMGTAVLVFPEQAQMTTFLLMLPARSNVMFARRVWQVAVEGRRVEFADQQRAIIGERHREDQ